MVINVYSKSESLLGRLLSNFANTPFVLNGKRFACVEAWWYWYITGEKHEHLTKLVGWKAKQVGRQFVVVKNVEKNVLKSVYYAKLEYNPDIKRMLIKSTEQFDHYYVYDGKKVPATKWLWTAKLWEEIRAELKQSDWSGSKVSDGDWKGSVT